MYESIQHLAIHPTHISVYQERIGKKSGSTNFIDFDSDGNPVYMSESFLKSSRKAAGTVSNIARRKMSRAIDYLVLMSVEKKVKERFTGKMITFKVAFITLTLPSKQIHTDSELINKCLNQFMIEAKKYYQVKNYVWRAEKQKNGNLHFHIILDKFIPWYEMRNRWNRIVNKLGYVDRFQEKHGHSTPNSTDIHSTRKIKDIRKYLAKYMSKNEKALIEIVQKYKEYPDSLNEVENYQLSKLSPKELERMTNITKSEIEAMNQTGRIWACNQELSNIKGCQLDIDSEVQNEVNKIISECKPRIYRADYFQVFSIDLKMIYRHSREILFKYFCDYLINEFGYYPQLKF